MRLPYRTIALTLLVLSLLSAECVPITLAESVDRSTEGPVSFRWVLVSLQESRSGYELSPITQDTMLKTGDRLKIYVEPLRQAFVYVVHKGPENELSLVFPKSFGQFESEEYFRGHHVPGGTSWFRLTAPSGNETFYLLGSRTRLRALERLIAEYSAAVIEDKIGIGNRVIDEIRRIRKKHHRFRVRTDTPTPILGQVRGSPRLSLVTTSDVESLAVVMTAKEFYGRTFTIGHK